MNGIILYTSKYGATEKYARWLGEETGFPVLSSERARPEDLEGREVILSGGGIHATGIRGLNFLKKNASLLAGKRLLVFCVGASPYDEKALEEIAGRNMTGPLSSVPLFYLRGAWDMAQMSLKDRMMCKMLLKVVSKKPPETLEPWMKALLSAGESQCDWTDRKYLEPILDALREMGFRKD